MSRALLLSVVLLVAACGETLPPERPLPAGLVLPAATVVGELPSSFGRVDVSVTAEGDLAVNGRACDLADLPRTLVVAAGGAPPAAPAGMEIPDEVEETEEVTEQEIVAEAPIPPDAAAQDPPLAPRGPTARRSEVREPDDSLSADWLLRVDGRVPWRAVVAVLMACAQPDVKLYRLFVEARGEGGGTGALAVFLPKDRGLCGGTPIPAFRVKLQVRPRRGQAGGGFAPTAVDDLAQEICRYRLVADRPLVVSIVSAPEAPWSAVVAALDAALRAGAYSCMFEGAPLDREATTMRALLGPPATAPACMVVVTGREEPRSRPLVGPLGPGRQAGMYGVSNANDMRFFEETEEELEEEVPAADAPGK